MANPIKLQSLKGAQIVAALGRVVALIVLMVWPGMLEPGFSADFRAGAAKAKITPEELGWLGGYGHRNRPAPTSGLELSHSKTRRDIAASWSAPTFTSLRVNSIARSWKRSVVGMDSAEPDVMLFATHTHSGPALPRGFDPGISWGLNEAEMRKLPTASDRVRDQTLDAIAQALADLQPAKLSFGRGKAAFGVNRRVPKDDGSYDFGSNPAGVSDPDVPVLLIESTKGVPRAVVFTYACHCTSIRNGKEGFYQYHPDYAGVAAMEVERQLPGSTALYATGCAGDIDPQPQGGVKQAEEHGQSLSAVVLATINQAKRRQIRGPLRTTYREIALPLAAIPSRQKYVELSTSRISYRQRHARYILAQMDAGTVPTEVPLPIQIWQFGKDLTLVALSGEVVVDYALRLKRELGAERTWPVAYANEVPCYIPSERILKEGGYEAGWDAEQGPGVPGATSNVLFYGWAAPLASGVEDRVITAVHSMLKK